MEQQAIFDLAFALGIWVTSAPPVHGGQGEWSSMGRRTDGNESQPIETSREDGTAGRMCKAGLGARQPMDLAGPDSDHQSSGFQVSPTHFRPKSRSCLARLPRGASAP